MKGFSYQNLAAGGTISQTVAALAALGSYPNAGMVIAGGDDVDLVFINGADAWRMFINTTTKDLTISRLAGTGSLNIPGVGFLKIGGKAVGEGAADSGGAGFRMLRYPN